MGKYTKEVQAKNIDEQELTLWITTQARAVRLDEITDRLSTFPPKVVKARLAAMVRKKMINGCACGCRGDFTSNDVETHGTVAGHGTIGTTGDAARRA